MHNHGRSQKWRSLNQKLVVAFMDWQITFKEQLQECQSVYHFLEDLQQKYEVLGSKNSLGYTYLINTKDLKLEDWSQHGLIQTKGVCSCTNLAYTHKKHITTIFFF